MDILPPVCINCIHMIEKKGPPSCKAFPDGIPAEIWLNGNPHKKPVKGQLNAIIFKAKDAKD